MSRIYDALQKAEAERGHDADAQPSTARNGLAGEHSRPRLAAALSATALEEVEIPRSAFEAVDHEHAHAAPATAVDLESITGRPWSPSVDQLPALAERGAGVEQFRSLRARLYELREQRSLKTVLVTSGLPQEGKSFVATNLALSLARNKTGRVLLIDGDMRRYTLHQLLGCESEPGLADYLAGRSSIEEILQRNANNGSVSPAGNGTGPGTPASMPPLAFIAGGNGGDRAADLSNNNRFEELIATLGPQFDWIIVDSSPVLPVSDAVNLSRACDGVLIVARSGVTQFEDAQRTQAELKSANLLGVVLNAVEHAKHGGKYYGYGYGYGHERSAQAS